MKSMRRVRTRIVDQHATWIAVNPVQGCPKSCRYCFLHERGQAGVPPEVLAGPVGTVDLLLSSPLYAPTRPVAMYTWTDVMALPVSRQHLLGVLSELSRRAVPNPVVLITKCHVPDEVIDAIAEVRSQGLFVLVYLSLSGLDHTVERGVRHAALMENFPRLADSGVPVVHYWRPGTPGSSSVETMNRVLDHAARYARCTVAAGLKVEAAALPRLAQMWPELAVTPGVTEAECVYPRAFWDFVHRTRLRHPHYPVFHTNSCALAYVLARSDGFGVFGSEVCRLRNNCPRSQRDRCGAADALRDRPDEADVRRALDRRHVKDPAFSLSADGREVTVHASLDTATAAALTQDLNTRVRVTRDQDDEYWNSGTAGAHPLVID